MENVVLIIHLILALTLIGTVLLQRSEGGALGIGGGGGAMAGRSAATAVSKFTWLLAIGFLCTSVALTIISARNSATASVADGIVAEEAVGGEDGAQPAVPQLPAGSDLLPPQSGDTTPLVPRAD